jgi:hypothetical protein
MSVVINEFEIVPVAEPPKAAAAPDAGATKPPTSAAATTQEVERALWRIRQRAMRLRAH